MTAPALTSDRRYDGRVRRGTNRALTDTETATLQAAVSRWRDVPPPQGSEQKADNTRVRTLLIDLFEDGVALSTLSAAMGWNVNRVAGVLHRARSGGMGTGTRRYIAPTPKVREAFRRDLTDDERDSLTRQFESLPRTAAGTARWRSPEATTLLTLLDRLANDRVSLDDLGAALAGSEGGMSRQAVHQHLTRFRRNRNATA